MSADNSQDNQEPSMEEILSSIRRIIADEDEPDADDSRNTDNAENQSQHTREDAVAADEVEELDLVGEDDIDEQPELEEIDLVDDDEYDDQDDELALADSDLVEEIDEDSLDLTEFDQELQLDSGDDVELLEEDDAALDLEPDLHAVDGIEGLVLEVSDEPATEPEFIQSQNEEGDEVTNRDDNLMSDTTALASAGALSKLTKAAGESNTPPPLPGSEQTVDALMRELLKPMLKDWLDTNLSTIVERVVEEEVKKLAKRAELG